MTVYQYLKRVHFIETNTKTKISLRELPQTTGVEIEALGYSASIIHK